MQWPMLAIVGLFALAWIVTFYQSWRNDWDVSRTAGEVAFLGSATVGVFYDEFLPAESQLSG